MTDGRPLLLGLTIFFLIFNVLSVSLRCYVRVHLVQKFGLDDYLLVVGVILVVIMSSFVAVAVSHGLGREDVANLSLGNIKTIMKYQTLCNIMYVADTAVVKLSVAILLLRISPKVFYERILWVLIVLMTSWNLVVTLITLFQCRPVSAAWGQYVGEKGKCLSDQMVFNVALGFSSVDIFFSFAFGLMPLPMLWKVQIPRMQKYGIWAILGLGVLSSIATAVRTKFIVDLNSQPNVVYTWSKADLWSVVELSLAIMAASIAALRPLFKQLNFPSLTRISGNGKHNVYAENAPDRDYWMEQNLVQLQRSASTMTLASRKQPLTGSIQKRMDVQVDFAS